MAAGFVDSGWIEFDSVQARHREHYNVGLPSGLKDELFEDEEHGTVAGASALDRLLKSRGVDLDHPNHRAHGSGRGLGVADQVDQAFGVDLPGDAEVVGDPAAGHGRGAGGDEFVPELVNFLLGVADDGDGDALAEAKLRATVERDERAIAQSELDCHDRAGLEREIGAEVGVVGDTGDLRVEEDAGVEAGSVLGLVVECQECGDPGHGPSLSVASVVG